MKNQSENMIFKIVSLGKFYQTLTDQITILNRPAVLLPNDKKKWGNEYILFQDKYSSAVINGCFYGKFFQDKKKKQSYLRLFDIIEVPVKHPDYYVVCRNHIGDKVDKWDDFEKLELTSHSMLFSSAYNYREGTLDYECENVYLVKDGDAFIENGKRYVFDATIEDFVEDTGFQK